MEPEQWADYRALTGDSSDNIRGVRGVGPVTARRLLSGGVGLGDLGNLDRLTGRIGEKIRDMETWDQLIKDRRLIGLRPDLHIPTLRELVIRLPSRLLPQPFLKTWLSGS